MSLNKQQLEAVNQNNFPNNNEGYITPELLREFNTDMIDSLVDEIRYNEDSASWNEQIALIDPSGSVPAILGLEQWSASAKLEISALEQTSQSLNQFTQSQIVLNGTFATTGSNTFYGDQTLDKEYVINTKAIYWNNDTMGYTNLEIANTGYGNLDLGALNGRVRIVGTPLFLTGSALTSSNDISTSANIYAANLTGSGNIDTSSFATTGSNSFTGSQTILSGAIGILNNGNSTTLTDTELDIETNGTPAASYIVSFNQTASAAVISYDGATYDNELWTIADSAGIRITDWDNGTGTLSGIPVLSIGANDGSQPAPQFNRGLGVTGSIYQSGTFYADQIDVSRGGIIQNTGSYVATFSSSGLLTYDTYQNVATALQPYISGSGGNIDTGSFATTGSNTFVGNQIVNANLTISSSKQLNFGSVGTIRDAGNGITIFDTNGGYQNRNYTTGEMYFEQNANNNLYVYNRGGSPISISGSSTYIQDVNFIPFSSSLNSRINAITGSGGGTAVGAITTGSNGQEQSITGSLGLTTLNNVSAINTLFTASTAPTPMEGTSSAVYFVSYSSVPDGNPNAFSVDASGNWSVSGSGVDNQIVTSVNFDDNGVLYEAGGATFTQGENYVFKAETFYNTLNVNGGIIQLQTDSGNNATVQSGNNAGDGGYPGFRAVVNSATNPGNIYSYHAIDDVNNSDNNFGFSLNTYTSFGDGLVGTIYGGGINNTNGTTDTMYFTGSKVYIEKDTQITGSLRVNGNIYATNLTGSAAPGTAYLYATQSFTGNNTFSGPLTASALKMSGGGKISFPTLTYGTSSYIPQITGDGFQLYQSQGQPYAFNINLQAGQYNGISGSQFLFGLVTNGNGQTTFGGSTYLGLISGSLSQSVNPGTEIKGGDQLANSAGGLEIVYNYAYAGFNQKVYMDKGLYVSQSQGGGKAITTNGDIIISGSLNVRNNITSPTYLSLNGNTVISGSLNVAPNNQLKLPSGSSNQQTGLATLNGSTPASVVVSNTNVTANSIIILTKQTNATPAAVSISSKGSGTFTIASTGVADTDIVAFMIINPS